MNKPKSLRSHLESWLPDLKKHPDKLHVYIDKGRVSTKAGPSASFEYHYSLQLLVTDFAEPVDTLIVPIMVWIAEHQPDLIEAINKQDKAIAFEAEAVDHDKIDISLTLDLSERVLIKQTATGYECEHIGEPPRPDITGPTGWTMTAGGEEFAP